jgi:iron complex outermembrane recepter protein
MGKRPANSRRFWTTLWIRCGVLSTFLLVLTCPAAPAQSAQSAPATQAEVPSQGDLTKVSIEDLMDMEVTSVSKKAEVLSAAPAAIFVITGEDIRRGGFSSVPDALRQVPGLHVAQQNAHVWVVAARGFSSFFNNKMLVLIDGRIVYTPTFGGVWWDVQDPPLDDIERIEVIRGPGGTLWGANAVNGVINIITKDAGKTQGALISTSAGVNEGYGAHVRYGGKAGDNLTYRVYGTSNYWLPTVQASGAENYDTWAISQGGLRFDWDTSAKDTLTFDGEGYSGRDRDISGSFDPTALTLTAASNFVTKGGHILGKWAHDFSERSKTEVLGYCDWTVRSDAFSGENRNICDFELQHSYSFSSRQALTWGASVLTTADTPVENVTVQFNPPYRRDTTYSAFAQYDVMVVPDKLRVIAGSKFEHNNYSGFEYQPQVRAVWTPTKSHTAWLAISRAVRTPTRVESDVRTLAVVVAPVPPTVLVVEGDPNLESEVLHAFEAGYRYGWKQKLALDAAVYYNGYDNLVGTQAPGAPFINPNPFYIGLPVLYANLGGGQTHGAELYLKYTPVRRWTVSTGITELRGNSVPGLNATAASADPKHQLNLQSKLDLTRHMDFDAAYYYGDAVAQSVPLPPMNRVDVGASTRSMRGFTFSVWGRNLQSNRHQETQGLSFISGEIRRSVVFKLRWESNSDQAKGRP